jgi:drug/metabolite transporter (DMT)-like permease
VSLFAVILVLLSTALHASWNLLAHFRRADRALFIRANLITGLVGLGPVLWAEFSGHAPFPPAVWGLLALTGIFQALYFLGLTRGYGSGDFTVVYPVARALPVLILALVDVARGRMPSSLGWLGIALVVLACLASPLESLRHIHRDRYLNHTGFWILITALGGAGYSTVDKIAAEMLAPGPAIAARYGVMEALFTVPYLWLLLRFGGGSRSLPEKPGLSQWGTAALAAAFIFTAYWLILWAYQLSPYASYVVALRQFSIVLGVVAAMLLFREPAPRLRISAAVVIAAGVACIAVAG